MTFSVPPFSSRTKRLLLVSVLVLGVVLIWSLAQDSEDGGFNKDPAVADNEKKAAGAKPALTVVAIAPQLVEWPQVLTASGNIAAWQEAVIGAEISNLQLTEVRVNVGDRVQKGDRKSVV